jgi:hypothetical protein
MRLSPALRHTNRQFSLPGEIQDFLDGLPTGTMSGYVVDLIRKDEKFASWYRDQLAKDV